MTHGTIEVHHPQTSRDETDTLEQRIIDLEHLLHEEGLTITRQEKNDRIRFEGPTDAVILVVVRLVRDNLLHRLEIEDLHPVHENEMGSDGG